MSWQTLLANRVKRGSDHVALASSYDQPIEDRLASALADLRAWANSEGVSFASAVELSQSQYIYSRVHKEDY